MRYLVLLALALTTTACSGPVRCLDTTHCTPLCPDGTPANAEPPYCPLNDRDLLPPPNDNVGVKASGRRDD